MQIILTFYEQMCLTKRDISSLECVDQEHYLQFNNVWGVRVSF